LCEILLGSFEGELIRGVVQQLGGTLERFSVDNEPAGIPEMFSCSGHQEVDRSQVTNRLTIAHRAPTAVEHDIFCKLSLDSRVYAVQHAAGLQVTQHVQTICTLVLASVTDMRKSNILSVYFTHCSLPHQPLSLPVVLKARHIAGDPLDEPNRVVLAMLPSQVAVKWPGSWGTRL
jgi:hypothetical protein